MDRDNRAEVRAPLRRRRAALSPPDRLAAAAQLVRHADHTIFDATMRLGAYVAVNGELDPLPLARAIRTRLGASLALPVIGESGTMTFRSWQPEDPLRANRYGIGEPMDGTTIEPDTVLVPCVAVDRHGARLGSGKGYYDRWLSDRHHVRAIAVVYDFQVLERVDPMPWDMPMMTVVTPTLVVSCG